MNVFLISYMHSSKAFTVLELIITLAIVLSLAGVAFYETEHRATATTQATATPMVAGGKTSYASACNYDNYTSIANPYLTAHPDGAAITHTIPSGCTSQAKDIGAYDPATKWTNISFTVQGKDSKGLFAPLADSEITAFSTYLSSFGLTVTGALGGSTINDNGRGIYTTSGTVQQYENAFHFEVHNYQLNADAEIASNNQDLPQGGKIFFAPAYDPAVPAIFSKPISIGLSGGQGYTGGHPFDSAPVEGPKSQPQ
jgi:hypothetical protein